MKTFLLVHGSHDGGWIWRRIVPLLQSGGNLVYAPTLTGLSDRSHLLNCNVNLTTHITDITNLIFYEDLKDVILVGNSYAGMVITGVAAMMPDRVKLLVYLDAYVPEDGQSEHELWPSEMRAAIEKDEAAKNGLRLPPEPEIFGITDPETVKWLKERMTPQPLSTYYEPVPAGNARSNAIPRVFIYCTEPLAAGYSPFTFFAEKAKSKGWPVYEMNTGHVSMITAPKELAELLVRLKY